MGHPSEEDVAGDGDDGDDVTVMVMIEMVDC